jgi:guanylate kinase
MKKGYVIIVSGPSGVGKGTLIKRVLAKMPNLFLAVSATTRQPREKEVEGVNYYFLSESEFNRNIEEDNFVEWCDVHQHKYGTLKEEVERYINNGKDVIVEIDIKGAKKVKSKMDRVISIFITPARFEDLIERLQSRNTEKKDVIARRLSIAGQELAEIGSYDYIVVNNEIDNAENDIINIIDGFRNQIII